MEPAMKIMEQNIEQKVFETTAIKQIEQQYSEKELGMLKKLRYRVEQMNLAKFYDSEYLIRFLKAREWNLEDSIEMFEIFIRWRQENDVDLIYRVQFPEIQQVRFIFPHSYHHTDKNGRPVYIECLGGLQYDEMIKQSEQSEQGLMTRERIGQYFISEFENLINVIFPACSKLQNRTVNQMIRIIDMKDYKLKPEQIRDFLSLTSKIITDNYPEILATMYIINASGTFKFMWNGIKLILPKATQKKIVVLGKDFKKELIKILDEECIPAQLGGGCQCEGGCLSKNVGPWNK